MNDKSEESKAYSNMSDKEFNEVQTNDLAKMLRTKEEVVNVCSEGNNDPITLMSSNYPISENAVDVSSKILDAKEAFSHGLMGALPDPLNSLNPSAPIVDNESNQEILKYAESQQSKPSLLKVENLSIHPYERYEEGKISFYDRSSSTEIGRFRVRDARDFMPDSMRRKPDTEKEGCYVFDWKKV
eukprot:CAMPEP_0116056736 /NCGR_PEP_ID=MMETSP0322-20121206/4189_1 /TAXON_ID=163516 /ORGANISM="Leptocylindrus danicus var. apora, Strain B651" /LENGTH=184 /DNA_ID=CAMNT_0003540605 /DNA_START=173 /DNA_END=728 /DNA_ORIENTATION=-